MIEDKEFARTLNQADTAAQVPQKRQKRDPEDFLSKYDQIPKGDSDEDEEVFEATLSSILIQGKQKLEEYADSVVPA